MEEQMHKERAEATRTSEHQLQSIMSELRALKEKHEKDTKERKIDEKTLLENIKASIDPILKSDHKTSDHISVGARLKHLQEEVTNYLPPTVNKKGELPSQLTTHSTIKLSADTGTRNMCIPLVHQSDQKLVTSI